MSTSSLKIRKAQRTQFIFAPMLLYCILQFFSYVNVSATADTDVVHDQAIFSTSIVSQLSKAEILYCTSCCCAKWHCAILPNDVEEKNPKTNSNGWIPIGDPFLM